MQLAASEEIAAQIEDTLAGYAVAMQRFAGNSEEIFQRFLDHAARRVPAWRELRWRGTRRETVKSLAPLDKSEVVRAPARFIASGCERSVGKVTSGFTGQPLQVSYDLCAQHVLNHVLYAYVFQLFPGLAQALQPGDVSIGFVTNKPGRDAQSVLLPMLGTTVWRRFPVADGMKPLHSADPPVLYGKPFYLRELADLMEGTKAPYLRPRCVLTSGERLYEDDRAALGAAFGGPIVNAYATTECGVIAVSRPDEARLLVQSQFVLVEVLKPSGEIADCGAGELIVTSAFNWMNPFLRYRTGDFGRVRRLPCGGTTIEGIHRRNELTKLGPPPIPARQIEDLMARFQIWDYRFRLVNGRGFLLWASRRVLEDRSRDIAAAFRRTLSLQYCSVRRAFRVAQPGGKRLRFPEPRLQRSG